jgi:TM2 domain-containing membrane protein YozV
MYCANCGNDMSESAKACPSCGHPVNSFDGLKSKVVFVLLALFLGAFGIHRMYLGDVGLGILYLLFFWTGIPMVVALFEAIIIGLRKNDSRFEQ